MMTTQAEFLKEILQHGDCHLFPCYQTKVATGYLGLGFRAGSA